jgi:hypothetical protein
MRRGALISLLLTVLAGTAVAAESTHVPAAYVRVAECSVADRSAVFHARMRRLPGTEAMSMRFTLLERSGSASYAPVRSPALAEWRRSRPGVREFGYRQRVEGLARGSVYRARVRFRWLDQEGVPIEAAVRRSPACKQFGALPNLRTSGLSTRAGPTADVVVYRITVANLGRAPAKDVPVRLLVDGAVVNTETIALIAPGESATVEFRGPRCSSRVRATVDPTHSVTESKESDNVRAVVCAQLGREGR